MADSASSLKLLHAFLGSRNIAASLAFALGEQLVRDSLLTECRTEVLQLAGNPFFASQRDRSISLHGANVCAMWFTAEGYHRR